MDKRLIFAIALSILILMSWSALTSKMYPPQNKELTTLIQEQEPAVKEQSVKEEKKSTLSSAPSNPSVPWKFSNDYFDITFDESRGTIEDVVFKNYKNHKLVLEKGFLLGNEDTFYTRSQPNPESVRFVHSDVEKQIIKVFNFSKASYQLELEIQWYNLSKLASKIDPEILLGVLNFSPGNLQAQFQNATLAGKSAVVHLPNKKEGSFGEVKFLSLRERYFCAIIQPEDSYQAFVKKENPVDFDIGMRSKETILNPGQVYQQKFLIFLGPQDLELLNSINPAWAAVVNYGMFNFIAVIMLKVLAFLSNLVHSLGFAIILLSILIYFLLYPLTIKQLRSAKEMQALQPKIEAIRQANKSNPQKMNKDIMDLYREHKVNPLGGCVPVILQIPIFFALYQALSRSVALKGASFLWIKDLSEPDKLFTLPKTLPFLGNEINLLPILMMIGMFFQQKSSMMPGSGSAAEQQKIMLIIFPLMFGFIFYHMPSGLVLYWFVNSILMLIYQLRIKAPK